MPNKKTPLFFDTVVLSNFANTENGIEVLRKKYKSRGYVTLQVLEEIAKALYAGLNHLEKIENLFSKTSLIKTEQETYILLLRNLGAGEASCISCAYERGGIVVTDDRMARSVCKERIIPVTGTLGILKVAYLDALITIDEADSMLKQMINSGFYSPVQKISDLL